MSEVVELEMALQCIPQLTVAFTIFISPDVSLSTSFSLPVKRPFDLQGAEIGATKLSALSVGACEKSLCTFILG